MAIKNIITKTVIGKGKKEFKNKYKITCEQKPTKVLGCWVINHKHKGQVLPDDQIKINGSYDINLWYSYDLDSKTNVASKSSSYEETLNIPFDVDQDLTKEVEVLVRNLSEPTCTDIDIKENSVKVIIEKTLGIEVISDCEHTIETINDDNNWKVLEDTDEEETIIPEIEVTEFPDLKDTIIETTIEDTN